jgi:hypothetical protein
VRGFTDPDSVFWRWLELRCRLASAPGHRIVVDRGNWYAPECPACGKSRRIEAMDEVGRSAWMCRDCGTPWPVDVGFLLANEYQRSLRGELAELPFVEMTTLESVLRDLSLWQQRIYLQLYLYEDVGSYADVAREAARRWPRVRRPWSEWRTGAIVRAARDRVMASLARRALLARPSAAARGGGG